MDKVDDLPFIVGQVVESKSFEKGFRGAWFRSKILEISRRQDHTVHMLEFIDFPDEKVKATKLYQKPPIGRKRKGMEGQLMVRPPYPPMYNESEMPPVDRITEVTVIVDGVWKVGDLVDWWRDDCYWSGRVSQILCNDKVQIDLHQPPEGEGDSYEASCKDLRPSLDWSLEDGWRVPIMVAGDRRCCARLILSVKQANSLLSLDKSEGGETREMSRQLSSLTLPKKVTHSPEANELNMVASSTGKPSLSDSGSCSHSNDTLAESVGHTAKGELYSPVGSSKKLKTGGSIPLNTMRSDTMDAAICDLEELAVKVKWLKGILEFGVPLSNNKRPPWKFVEHRASSAPK